MDGLEERPIEIDVICLASGFKKGEPMQTTTKTILTFVFSMVMSFSISRAENLHIVSGELTDHEILTSLEDVNVYAILEDAILIGTTTDEVVTELRKDPAIERVQGIGERDIGSDYFLFQIVPQDVKRLAPGIDMIYYNGKDAVVRIDRGMGFDQYLQGLGRGLTRISFVPRSSREHDGFIPNYEPLADPVIQGIVDQVSQVRYTAYIQSLQDFVTRYSYTNGCRAAEQWAVDTFEALGLETELFPYSYSGNTWYNPIGRKIGTLYPDSIYMIVGHIDATSDDPYNLAPGAEDNGSGSACVLEAARVLSQYDFDCTIEFTLFSGEEQGLIGSEAYASYCVSENRNIGGVLNFDMISYAGSFGWDTNIYSDQTFPAEVALAELLAQLTDEYSDAFSIRVNTFGPIYGSDHYYFSQYGFPAVFSIDAQFWSADDWYPWYHTTDDVIEHLDLDFGTEVVKGAVATLATIANLSTLYTNLSTELIPDDDPTIVPQGGSFGMTASVTNTGSEVTTTDVWLGAYRGTRWFQQRLVRDLILDSGETRQAHLTQDVPPNTPPGDYSYVEFCGDYDTWTVIDSSYFDVTVTGLLTTVEEILE
jgi:hypothetical protein